MSIELKQVVEQSLDLSTPTLREMVTRHAAGIDSRATLEDMPEALAFQIDMARALLREFAAIQQAEAQQPATGEPVAWLDEMLADTREVFDAGGSETPQVVRDVIEYVKSWVTVYSEKNHPAPAAQPAPSVPKDDQIAALVNKVRDIARMFHDHQSLRERIAIELVPALKASQEVKSNAERFRRLNLTEHAIAAVDSMLAATPLQQPKEPS